MNDFYDLVCWVNFLTNDTGYPLTDFVDFDNKQFTKLGSWLAVLSLVHAFNLYGKEFYERKRQKDSKESY